MTDLKNLSTEQSNRRSENLDKLPVKKLLQVINREDATVARAVAKAIPQIEKAVKAVSKRLASGGRLFYIGAGTSGRLGVTDASEMPPTYGVPHTLVQGIIAGGFGALLKSKEGAEDDASAGIADIKSRKIGKRDAVIGLSVSGRARYVREALNEARRRGAFTGCITCNRNSLLIACADIAIVAETGPEVVTGSTRMKAGTAQKMILNMISTATMVQLGRVKGNRMVDLQLKCEKLHERARNLIMEETGASAESAAKALKASKGSVRKAIAALRNQKR
jgi:N-acetylmuramic acid 6-phosphate etherase